MFLQPLSMLHTIRRWPCLSPEHAEELIRFLPRYKRARILVEVVTEGLPQSVCATTLCAYAVPGVLCFSLSRSTVLLQCILRVHSVGTNATA